MSRPSARSRGGWRLAGRAFGRGLTKRCPRCGHGRLFRRWTQMVERCPGCGLRFEREEGYWTGAMIVNIAIAEVAFLVVLVAGIASTWPDVPWGLLTVVAVAVNAVVPILFYPYSKTIWMALDVLLHRMDRQDHGVDGNGGAAGRMTDHRTLRRSP